MYVASAALLAACTRLSDTAIPTPTPYAVTTTTRSFSYTLPDGSQRTIDTDVWYPTSTDAPRPLIVFSHGSGGKPADDGLFLSYVASQGFVVAAPRHQDCSGSCSPSEFSTELLRRPLDMRTVVDGMLGLDGSAD